MALAAWMPSSESCLSSMPRRVSMGRWLSGGRLDISFSRRERSSSAKLRKSTEPPKAICAALSRLPVASRIFL